MFAIFFLFVHCGLVKNTVSFGLSIKKSFFETLKFGGFFLWSLTMDHCHSIFNFFSTPDSGNRSLEPIH